MTDLRKYLTVDDVAARIGKSPSWVYGEARAKRIPHQRVGRDVRFTEAQVEQIDKLFEVQPTTDAPNVAGLSPRSRRRRRVERMPRAG